MLCVAGFKRAEEWGVRGVTSEDRVPQPTFLGRSSSNAGACRMRPEAHICAGGQRVVAFHDEHFHNALCDRRAAGERVHLLVKAITEPIEHQSRMWPATNSGRQASAWRR